MPETELSEGFIAALKSLVAWLEAEQVPYAAVGGVAVSLIAQPRATQDIDALIWLDDDRWEGLLRSGEDYGLVPRLGNALEFARRARVLLLRHEGSGVSIDVSCGVLVFERELVERARLLDLGYLVLRVPTPEDLIVTKAVAHRPKDLVDIESILQTQPDLDLDRVRYWVGQFAQALEMPELSDDLERLLRLRRPLS